MPLIKSHSNYVLKKKHQLINDGTVFERDITTIGAVNQFAPGQTPIYRSGNFIITVNDDRSGMNQYNTQKWEKGADGDTWTIATVDKMVSQDETQNDTKIVLKNDYYDFREFAYYGSLTELFRSSITDILTRFPGELFCVSGNTDIGGVYYTSSYTEDFESIKESVRLGGTSYYEVSNPYGINIHSAIAPQDAEPLKYFANGGYLNYTFNGVKINEGEWTVTPFDGCKVGDKVAEITIKGKKLYAYIGDGNKIVYLHTADTNNVHIRPAESFITDFYNGCNDLQRIMLNPDTSPKYRAVFSVLKANDFGYLRELQEFIYPTSEGGYNPSADGNFINRLVEIGDFYDEYLTDNLYRIMTHEAIKNFDWTYTREYNEGDENEYVHGGEKIQKALRIFAREFDEQKKYIDNIRNTGRLTYDERSNIPDYFLADLCEDDGWDVKSVIPYDLEGDYWTDTSTILKNTNSHKYSQSSSPVIYPYSNDTTTKVKDGTQNGYFLECNGTTSGINGCLATWYPGGGNCTNGSNMSIKPANAGEKQTILAKCDGSTRIESVIKSYFDNTNKYTYMDVNNEFLRRLRLNSRQIWKHKGTLEGIEMILGMFGMKSKRWLCKNESCRYTSYSANTCGNNGCNNTVPDYEIIEYTQFTSPIEDTWMVDKQMFKIDWINSTKTIVYDNRSTSNYTLPGNMGAYYGPYQGLPVAYRDINSTTRKLYPSFSHYDEIDGNPYFQMDGGWLAKVIGNKGVGYQNFQFDMDDNIVHNPVTAGSEDHGIIVDNHKMYKETIRSIRRVDDFSELLSLPQSELYDGIICYVGRIGKEIAIIDGEAYDVEYDNGKKFVRFTMNGGFVKVGDLYFDESISVLGPDRSTVQRYSLDDKLDGYEIRAFIGSDNTTFVCKSGDAEQYTINSFKLIDNATESETYSNYFKLDDVVFSDEITYSVTGNGWRRLQYKDTDYMKINTIYNYYEGNNGHNGLMKYDSGHEYFTYFNRLFKYAEDNGMFDTRCYAEGFDDLYELLHPGDKPIGFRNLINENENIKDYDKFLSADTKVHYFGNYKTRNDDNTIKDINIYGDDVDTNEWKKFYRNGITPTKYSIGGGVKITNEIQPHTSSDSVTNQIVNNKRIKIIFNMKNKFNTKDGQIELKYVDDIVMNYLTQMIPSTVITEIEYDFCGFNNTDC